MCSTALNVALYFIHEHHQKQSPIDALKLQKLLYYSQGLYLALFNKPLFPESIEHWEHGPVVRPVYNEFKEFQYHPLSLRHSEKPPVFDESTQVFLDKVMAEFASYEGATLRELTHSESPWLETKKNQVITTESLQLFFEDYVAKTPTDYVIAAPKLEQLVFQGQTVQYKVITDLTEGGYVAQVLGRPGCMTQAETLTKLVENVKFAIEDWDDASQKTV